jgi:hypothetical protein
LPQFGGGTAKAINQSHTPTRRRDQYRKRIIQEQNPKLTTHLPCRDDAISA